MVHKISQVQKIEKMQQKRNCDFRKKFLTQLEI